MLLGAIGLLALGGGLIWLAVELYNNVEPYCRSNGLWECVDSAEEQRADTNMRTFLFVFVPGALLVAGGLRMVFLVLDRKWPSRW